MTPQRTATALKLALDLRSDFQAFLKPPSGPAPSNDHGVVAFSIVRGSRGYIEQLVHQINGTYAAGWYDSCLVMIRRLTETLIIEAFEAAKIESKIKNSSGDYFFLGDLISAALSETSWTLGRNVRKSLPKLKDVGDKSAHSRRFIAHRPDVDAHIADLRQVVQEFLYIAKLK